MSHVTFDRFKLSIPSACLTIINESVFTTTLSGEGELLRRRYEQTSPFYYSVYIDQRTLTTEIEFSGKALMDDYPSLICKANITTCFENINSYGICYINSEQVLHTAIVKQCDVTFDVASPYSIKDLYTNINLSSSKKWCIRDICSNRFTIESTNTTNRFKSRFIVYDKGEEMTRKSNTDFLSTVRNPEEQLEYYKDKTRIELNLNSMNRISHFFGVSDTRLMTLLHSTSDPIAVFLTEAMGYEDTLHHASKLSGSLRNLEHLLLLAICEYDLNRVELLIRNLYGASRSIKRSKEPYAQLLNRLKEVIPEPKKNMLCTELTSNLKYMLGLLRESTDVERPNLRNLYASSRERLPKDTQNNPDTLFNINFQSHPMIVSG